MKALIALVVLGVAGWLVYTQVLASPASRICDRMADLCGAEPGKASSCEEDLDQIGRMLGDRALERIDDCVAGSEQCLEATACMGAGLTREALEDVVEGIERGLKN